MAIRVGTFNLNNLFKRFDFEVDLNALPQGSTAVASTVALAVVGDGVARRRVVTGSAVQTKPDAERATIAKRIKRINLDILAAQEVEDIDALREFNRDDLDGLYRHRVLVEGNDPRLIDVAILSKLPIGGVTSWQHAVHPSDPTRPVFSRDLLEVEILNPAGTRRLFTLFNTHLKSHHVPFNQDQALGARLANERRQRQAETAARIVAARTRPSSRYVITGDLNDPPESPFLAPLLASPALNLVNALTNPIERPPAKADTPPPPSTAWTHRFKEAGKPAAYELFDQIWLSPALAPKQSAAGIDRRTKHGGDGSDHDPAWIALDL